VVSYFFSSSNEMEIEGNWIRYYRIHQNHQKFLLIKVSFVTVMLNWRICYKSLSTVTLFLGIWSWALILRNDDWYILFNITFLFFLHQELYEWRCSIREHNRWQIWRSSELQKDLMYCHPRWPEERKYILQVNRGHCVI